MFQIYGTVGVNCEDLRFKLVKKRGPMEQWLWQQVKKRRWFGWRKVGERFFGWPKMFFKIID